MADSRVPSGPLVKVRLTDGSHQETLWAEDLGHGQYRLDNQPWYAYDVSCGDIVEACAMHLGAIPDFVRVVERSGNRTVRVITQERVLPEGSNHPVLRHLRSLGCEYEGSNGKFFAVTIPPGVDLLLVRDYLIGTGLQWEHADPSFETLFPGES